MALSDNAMSRLTDRGLDLEVASRLGLDSEVRRWPVEEGNGKVRFVDVEALLLPYFRAGELVRRKYKAWERPEGAPAYQQDKGGLRIAYNEDCLRDDSLLSQPLIITEGELDAIAAIQAGFARVISVPDGAPPPKARTTEDLDALTKYDWLKEIRPLLTRDRAPEIILATDGDDNGAALMQDLSVLLGRFRCKFLTYPKRGDRRLKDLNEVLQHYGSKGVVETVNRAQWIRVDGVYRMGELPPLPPSVIYEPRHRLFSENFKVRLGDFSVVTGTPGFGKTTFANDVFCGIACDNHLTIAWASFEQEPQRDHRRNLRSWFCGQPEHTLDPGQREAADRWIDAQHLFLIPSENEDPDLEWLLDKMELAATRYAARIFIIDPWNELEHARERDETETEYVGRAIRRLKRFAKAFKVHVCIIAHPTKSVKDAEGNYKMPTLYDIAGSANWYNKADLGVIVHRENEDDTLIKVQKSRYHEIIGKPGEVRMHYSKDQKCFIETERVA